MVDSHPHPLNFPLPCVTFFRHDQALVFPSSNYQNSNPDMPPVRTLPPAKAVKTERTHEENQERAYIAASRRSDRSLEARVESARRASEIHKRRTGRSLRVTEQDVINEEMYEEEDDDLPLQYRRLTAHLQTGSVDFNRRLAAYLTNQVAIRSAIDQMVTSSYAQQYPNAPQFAHNHQNPYPSPMLNTNMPPPSPSTFRSAPYPSPGMPNYRPHQRSTSIATTHEPPHSQAQSPVEQHNQLDRRMSMPTPTSASASPLLSRSTPSTQDHDQQHFSPQPPASYPGMWGNNDMFTTSLPAEAQQLLGPALDPNDPFTSMLMAGSEPFVQNQYYPWPQASTSAAKSEPHPSWNNMSATLAPSALDMPEMFFNPPPTKDAPTSTPAIKTEPNSNKDQLPSSGLDFSFESSQKGINFGSLSREDSAQGFGSGHITPGEGFWDSFINDSGYGEESAS